MYRVSNTAELVYKYIQISFIITKQRSLFRFAGLYKSQNFFILLNNREYVVDDIIPVGKKRDD
jgi:hypothetical protein